MLTEDVQNQFVFGKGWCYGGEFLVKKNKGKWTGWIGYTLSWAWRKFPQIDNGVPFLAQYDRRHDLSVVQMYEINKHWKIAGTFVFQSGNRATLPVSYYLVEGQPVFNYGPRNWYHMPPIQPVGYRSYLCNSSTEKTENLFVSPMLIFHLQRL